MIASSGPKAPSAKLFWLTWSLVVALAISSFFFIVWNRPPLKSTVFRWTAGKYQPFPPAKDVYPIRVSDGGVVWVGTETGLSRLENGVWRNFTTAEVGATDGSFGRNFTLDGEDVWAASPTAVLHFDGERWTSHVTAKTASIAAADGRAWTIDAAGNLAQFDGEQWTVKKLELPGVKWGGLSSRLSRPQLAAAAGRLWLVFQGVWRYDGKSWTQVPGLSREATLLGVTPASTSTGGGLYVLEGGKVQGFDSNGVRRFEYKTADLGKGATVYEVAGRAPTFVIAYSAGLYLYDGNNWRFERQSKLGVGSVSRIAVAPDQSVWGIGYVRGESALHSRIQAASLVLCMIAVFYPMWYRDRKAKYGRAAAKEALLHATGELPDDLKAKEAPAWATALGVMLALAVIFGGFPMIRKYWPGAPIWLLPVGFVLLHVGSTLVEALKPRKAKPNDPIHPGGGPEVDWAKSGPAILGGLAVIILLYGGAIARFLHIPYVAAMPGFAILLGGQWLFRRFDAFRARRVRREVMRGNYAGARQVLDGLLAWPATGLWKLTRAQVLFYWNKAAEAEAILRELLDAHQDTKQRTLALEELGRVLLAQSRYEDARRAFEAMIQMAPMRPAAHSGLAELRLIQGVEAGQALENVRRARQLQADRKCLGPIWADEAWALAMLGQSSEAQQAVEVGARELDKQHRPEVAGFHWRVGMTMLALEQTTVALQWFVKAAEIDPAGYYGALAVKHRSQHSVWGAVGMRGV